MVSFKCIRKEEPVQWSGSPVIEPVDMTIYSVVHFTPKS